jgi:hypothetical protein
MKKIWTPLLAGALLASTAVSAQETLAPITPTDRITVGSSGPACLATDTRSFGERLIASGFPNSEAAAEQEALIDGGELMEFDDISVDVENAIEAPTANPSAVWALPGEFLVSTWNNMNWQYNMHFGAQRTFKKIIFDTDFYVGQWAGRTNDDTTYYGGRDYYCLLWLQSGSSWDNTYAYMNFLYPGSYAELQSNIGGYWNPQYGEYGLKIGTGCGGVQSGNTYHYHYEYDAQNGIQFFTVTRNGQTVCSKAGDTGVRSIDTSYMFLQIGSQYAPEGPEGATIGWRFSNMKIQFIGDELPGRRPRRR